MYRFYAMWAKAKGRSAAWTKKHAVKVYRHWKKLAGAKNYVSWRQVYAKVRKNAKC